MLLFGTCAWALVNGQFGQSTTLGFAVFMAGLTLASMRVPQMASLAVPVKQRSARLVPEKVRAQWAAIAARKAVARGEIIRPDAPL
jgi:cytochrome c oxidase assembly factor CtaG